ncbi:MAG TPA: GNAT family N-acetyltransferase [Candidatus Thermoplasmatota archaeon]|nr:GNAT family N-acetyltransferase [Candidatus Thermoplasmatota archaeon]
MRSVINSDGPAVIGIFNHYIEHSYAAFPEKPLPFPFFEKLRDLASGYPFYVIETDQHLVVGFGFLHAFRPMEVFGRSAETSYFIHPEHCRKGLGTQLLDRLIQDGKARGIDTLIATISSMNPESIMFHRKNGFHECGRLKTVGRKFATDFDIVIMQRVFKG